MTTKRIKIVEPVFVDIIASDSNERLCGWDCEMVEEYYVEPPMDAYCQLFGRLRWTPNGEDTIRHKRCLGAVEVRRKERKR